MTFPELKHLIVTKFGESTVIRSEEEALQPSLTIQTEKLGEVCQELQENENCYFDFLSCITGIDNGPKVGTMEVVYQLYSIPYDHHLMLKVELKRNEEGEPAPEVPSLSALWRTANWQEREIYDLLGIRFTDHPDLRRILLPKDWEGHPLRKDYQHQERYHGIQVKY